MSFDIGIAELKSIAKDGVKAMIHEVAGNGGQGSKRRGYFKSVKNVIQEYQQRLEDDFLPVLVKDFAQDIVIKFTAGQLSEENKSKINMFLDMVEKSDIKSLEENLVRKLEELREGDEGDESFEKFERLKKVVVDGHNSIVRRIDSHIRSVIKDTMFWRTLERSKLKAMLYNFVDGDVPENVKKVFENGVNSVPSTKLTKKDVDNRVEEALLEYLIRLGRRRIYGYYKVLHTTSVKEWLRKVKLMSIDAEIRKWIEDFENYYPALLAELDLVYSDVKLDTKEELVEKLEREDCVMVMCDKNMGMSLFTLETMRKADETLMKQLGAVQVKNTKEEIIAWVKSEIKKFVRGLTVDQKNYMDNLHGGRQGGLGEVAFPFLRCQHKVHKMTEEDIRNKDLSKLKFRPVVDAKQWLTRGYAEIIMQMMREACSTLVDNGGPVMNNIKSKDGWRFSVEMRDYIAEERFEVMVTADIEEAYTNIDDNMIKNAIGIVCKFLVYEEWKIELMEKLVDLVLDQNFVETSEGFFKFKKVLPMGYKLSGDALDIVAVAEEMLALYNLGVENSGVSKVRIGELKNYPVEFVRTNSVHKELSMAKGVNKFKRYVDDIHSLIAGSKKDILNGLLAIGYMYPECLVISMNLSIWHSRFLDVFTWRSLDSREISAVMNKNSEAPVGHVRKGSNHPDKYKLQSLLGEMLRGRRIASDKEMIQHSDKCTAHEFQSIGYSRREVEAAMEEAKQKFDEKYSGMFVKINDELERRYFSYGGGLVYNKNYRYGEVVMNFIDNVKPHGEPGILLLPDVKIKRLAFTKKRYLKRQDEDKKKSKF